MHEEDGKQHREAGIEVNQEEMKKMETTLPPGYHMHEDGTVHCHDHGHAHMHTQTKQVVNRLARAIGHLESVKSMVENGRDCTEVLIQLAAVRSALTSTAKVILKDHMEHCLRDEENDAEEQLLALNEAIDKFM